MRGMFIKPYRILYGFINIHIFADLYLNINENGKRITVRDNKIISKPKSNNIFETSCYKPSKS